MRNCRICLRTDVLSDMIACFDNVKIIVDLNYLAGISIVEVDKEKALICRRCVKNLKQAVEFKKMCTDSDLNFKRKSNEHYEWFSNLRLLKVSSSSKEEEEEAPDTGDVAQQGPAMSDAENLIKETIQSREKTDKDYDQFSLQVDAIGEEKVHEEGGGAWDLIHAITDQQLQEATSEISSFATWWKEILQEKEPTLLASGQPDTKRQSITTTTTFRSRMREKKVAIGNSHDSVFTSKATRLNSFNNKKQK